MNNKGSAVAILTIIIVVLLGVVGYLLFKQAHIADDAKPDTATPGSMAPPSANTSKTGMTSSKRNRVVLDVSDFGRQYKTLLTKAFKNPADFNEHYVVAEIGCGPACFYYVVIDKDTGKVYEAPVANDLGEFSGDIGESYSLHSNLMKIITDNGSKVDTYAFTGAGFSLVSSQPAR